MSQVSIKILKQDNLAFFCCDIQERFVNLIQFMPTVISTAQLLLKSAQIFDIPTVVTQQYPKALGQTVPELDISHCKVFDKKKFSMMIPEVREVMNNIKKSQVLMFGIESHVCIQQTTLDLLKEGYEVFLVTDGISSQKAIDRTTSLKRMETAGATLVTSEGALFEIMKSADHTNFKQISQLLKAKPPPTISSI